MLFAALLWAVMQYGIWRAIDAAAAQDFTGWVFAVAHLLFGMMAASFGAVGITDPDPVSACPAEAGGAARAVTRCGKAPAHSLATGRLSWAAGRRGHVFRICQRADTPVPGLPGQGVCVFGGSGLGY